MKMKLEHLNGFTMIEADSIIGNEKCFYCGNTVKVIYGRPGKTIWVQPTAPTGTRINKQVHLCDPCYNVELDNAFECYERG